MSSQTDLEALQALEEDVAELESIKSHHDCFNIFKTMGIEIEKNEVMHSNFLASLLDPNRNGRIGDRLIKGMLLHAASFRYQRDSFPPPLDDLDSMDLSHTLVEREPHYIDILLTNKPHKLALIVENKIWSSEGLGQLDRYYRIVSHQYPGWHIFGIFLTPNGSVPTHEAYWPLSYGAICEVTDDIFQNVGSTLDYEVKISAQHYVKMIKRNILGDPEIVELCHRLYEKHTRAFDLMYANRPDFQNQIRSKVKDLIMEHPELELDETSKDTIKFAVKQWDGTALQTAVGWTASNRILLFQFANGLRHLDLHMFMGPGDEGTRLKLLEMIRANSEVFLMPRNPDAGWHHIFQRRLLRRKEYEDLDRDGREQEIRRQWDEFLGKDLPRIREALSKESWIWES